MAFRRMLASVSGLPRRCTRGHVPAGPWTAAALVATASLALTASGTGQPAAGSSGPYTVLTKDARQGLSTTLVNGREMVALDDLARLFQLTVREDTLPGGLTITARGKTLVLSTTQGLASAGGRLASLSGPPVRQGRSWLVPLDAMSRALPLVLDTRIDVRRNARLVAVGDVRVPRVALRTQLQPSQARVLLEITPPTPHTVQQDGARLIVRFEAEALDATIEAAPASPTLSAARVLDQGAAVALELGPAYDSYRASDEPDGPDGTRLIIDLLPNAAARPAPAPATTAATPPEPPPAVFEPPRTALRTVVLDPGHGGDETGAKGPNGTMEKDIAFGVARQLKALLESRLGVRVLMTRDGDQTVPLDDRAAMANNNKADVFLSLHANASVRDSARGAEVFYLSAGEYNAEARQSLALEGELLPVVNGGERKVEMILWEMAQLQHLEDSAALATLVEQRLRSRLPMSARAIQQAPFRVLVGANMPAVLVEMGFVTNPEEEKLLASPAHQAEVAQALFDSLVQFRSYLENGRQAVVADGARPPGAR